MCLYCPAFTIDLQLVVQLILIIFDACTNTAGPGVFRLHPQKDCYIFFSKLTMPSTAGKELFIDQTLLVKNMP